MCNYYEKQKEIPEAKSNGDRMKGRCHGCGQPINSYQPGETYCGGNKCLDDYESFIN